MAIVNDLIMKIDNQNIVVYPKTVGRAVYINESNGYNLIQALADLRNNAKSDWLDISNKPFVTLGNSFKVIEGQLQLNGSMSTEWNDIQNKPSLYNSSWSRIIDKPTAYPSSWADLADKPQYFPTEWNYINNRPEDFVSSWEDIRNKPESFPTSWNLIQDRYFDTINNQDFWVNSFRNELRINNLIRFYDSTIPDSASPLIIYENLNSNNNGIADKYIVYLNNSISNLILAYGNHTIIKEMQPYYSGFWTAQVMAYWYNNSQNYFLNEKERIHNGFNIFRNDNVIYGSDNNVIFQCPIDSSYLFANGAVDVNYLSNNILNLSKVRKGDYMFYNAQILDWFYLVDPVHSNNNIVLNLEPLNSINYIIQNFKVLKYNYNTYNNHVNTKNYISIVFDADKHLKTIFREANLNNNIYYGNYGGVTLVFNNFFANDYFLSSFDLNLPHDNITISQPSYTNIRFLTADSSRIIAVYNNNVYNNNLYFPYIFGGNINGNVVTFSNIVGIPIKEVIKDNSLFELRYNTAWDGTVQEYVAWKNVNTASINCINNDKYNFYYNTKYYSLTDVAYTMGIRIDANTLVFKDLDFNNNNLFPFSINYNKIYSYNQYGGGNNARLARGFYLKYQRNNGNLILDNCKNFYTYSYSTGGWINFNNQNFYGVGIYNMNMDDFSYNKQILELRNAYLNSARISTNYISYVNAIFNISTLLQSNLIMDNYSYINQLALGLSGYPLEYNNGYNLDNIPKVNINYLLDNIHINTNYLTIFTGSFLNITGSVWINNLNMPNGILGLTAITGDSWLEARKFDIYIYNNVALNALFLEGRGSNENSSINLSIYSNKIKYIKLRDYDYNYNYDYGFGNFTYQPTGYADDLREFEIRLNGDRIPTIIDFNTDYPVNFNINIINNTEPTYIYVIPNSILDRNTYLNNSSFVNLPNGQGRFYGPTNLYVINGLSNHRQRKLYITYGGIYHDSNITMDSLSENILTDLPDDAILVYDSVLGGTTNLELYRIENNFFIYNNNNTLPIYGIDNVSFQGAFGGASLSGNVIPQIYNLYCNVLSNNIMNNANILYLFSGTYFNNQDIVDFSALENYQIHMTSMSFNNVNKVKLVLNNNQYNNFQGYFGGRSGINYIEIQSLFHDYVNSDTTGPYTIADCFGGCANLKQINLNFLNRHCSNTMNAFGGCTNLTDLTVYIAGNYLNLFYVGDGSLYNLRNVNIIFDGDKVWSDNTNYYSYYLNQAFWRCPNSIKFNLNFTFLNMNNFEEDNFDFSHKSFYFYIDRMVNELPDLKEFTWSRYFNGGFNWILPNLERMTIEYNTRFYGSGGMLNSLTNSNVEYMRFISQYNSPKTTDYPLNNYFGYYGVYLPLMVYMPSVKHIIKSNYYYHVGAYCNYMNNAVVMDCWDFTNVTSTLSGSDYSSKPNMAIGTIGKWTGAYQQGNNGANVMFGGMPEELPNSTYISFAYCYSNCRSLYYGFMPGQGGDMYSGYNNCPNLVILKPVYNTTNMYGQFNNCRNLPAVIIPPSIDYSNEYNASYSFYGCTNLRLIDASRQPGKIYECFVGCTNIEKIYLNNELTNLTYCFQGSTTNLKEIIYNGTNLTNYSTASDGISSDWGFVRSYYLTNPIYSNGLESMCFAYCNRMIHSLCGSATIYMNSTYQFCHNLLNCVVGDKVNTLNNTFFACNNLPYAIIKPNVLIYYNTYFSCTNIRKIVGLDTLNNNATLSGTFIGCSNLTTLNNTPIYANVLLDTFWGVNILDTDVYLYANYITNIFDGHNNEYQLNLHINNRAYQNNLINLQTIYKTQDPANFVWTPAEAGSAYNYYNTDLNVYLFLDDV